MPPTLAAAILRNVKTKLSKTKRREHRSPPLFLLGALQSAARTAHLQQGGMGGSHGGGATGHGMDGQGGGGGNVSSQDLNAQMVERLREQIRGLGATPDL